MNSPKALKLIEQLDEIATAEKNVFIWALDAVNELERLYAVNQELVKALNGVIAWDKTRNFLIPYCVRDPIHTALAKFEREELREESHDRQSA